MRKKSAGLLCLVLAAGLGSPLGLPSVSAAPAAMVTSPGVLDDSAQTSAHEPPNPLEDKRRALREEAITQLLNGTGTTVTRGGSTVMEVSSTRTPAAVNARGRTVRAAKAERQYVELSREKTDKIFVVLAEFGDEVDPRFPNKDLEPDIAGPTTFEGPLHNKIPAPDRAQDNTTVWQADYDRAHYQNLYFGDNGAPGSGGETESVKQYYERQSSGRYSVEGTVTNWVKVKYNEARYGRSSDDPSNGDDPNVCASHVCQNTWALVQDAVDAWYADQLAAGRSKADVDAELASFDEWDRYDVDTDGNFNESDGYLDHFQIVHAGGDEADGDPIQGEDAIWSHRWYANATSYGQTGPAAGKQGGAEIGDSGIWVGDYTAQPENGGVSVFTHEYGHDLGLPDLYDTSGPPPAQENGVNFWSLMAQSRVDAAGSQGLGTRAADLGAWEKLQLGWLDYETVVPDGSRTLKLGPHEYNTRNAQALVTVLPKKEVTSALVEPFSGSKSWWSGTGDDYTASMSRSVTVPAGGATLAFQAQYNLEADYDYAFVEVDDGSGWVSIPGTGTDPAVNNGITGDTDGAWVPMSFDLSAFAGQEVTVRVRYATDGAVQGNDPELPPGIFLDDITLGTVTDGAETEPGAFTLDGFRAVGSTVTQSYDNYYIASNRAYVSFDRYLRTGPYNFGFTSKPDFVERFPYQNGLLVSYWDTSQSDNNASQHPGEGLILPVDANPAPRARLDGGYWRPRVAGYDATFGRQRADTLRLHHEDQVNVIRGAGAQPLFDDSRSYWDARQPTNSVKVPDTGTSIRVLRHKGTQMTVRVTRDD